MTSVLDLWRVLDPEARLISGSTELLARPVRGVNRTRAGPPHLPTFGNSELLIADSSIVAGASVEAVIAAIADADVRPSAVWVADASETDLEPSASPLPVIAGAGSASAVAAAASRHLEHEDEELRAISASLRLAAAEAALTDPQPSAPAGVVASRLRRGIAVAVDGGLVALNPRPAGRALATRFAAMHSRLLAERSAVVAAARHTRDGLWVLERPIDPGATAWLFDDLPLAALDGVGLDALALTLRALLRRRSPEPARARGLPKGVPSTGDSLHDTLLAVARANGRIAPAARALGVHRNTVLYRIRRGVTELGVDPRRPEDAWRIMRDAQRDEPG